MKKILLAFFLSLCATTSIVAQCFNMESLDDPNTFCEVWKYQQVDYYTWGFRLDKEGRDDYGVGNTYDNPYGGKGITDCQYTTHTIIHERKEDSKVSQLMTLPQDESTCIRIGRPFAMGKLNDRNNTFGARAEHIGMYIDVTKENAIFLFKYAAVMQAPDNHYTNQSDNEVPQMFIEIYDVTTGFNQIEPNRLSFYLLGKPSLQTARNWKPCTLDGVQGYWHDWQTYGFDVSKYIGHTLCFYIENDECALNSTPVYGIEDICAQHYGYMYFHLSCAESKIDYECQGQKLILTAPEGFLYKWYKQGSNRLLGEEQTLELNASDPVATYRCDLYFMGQLTNDYSSLYVTPEKCQTMVEKTDSITLCSNELPYQWRSWNNGGKTITSIAQDYLQDTVYKYNYIDSIITLRLTILKPTKGDTTAYVCPNSTFYWRNIEAKDGDSIILNNANCVGCDSIVFLKLITLPEPELRKYKDTTICFGDSYSDEHFSHLDTTGTYNDSIKFINYPCDSIIYQLILHVSQPTTSEDSIAICQNTPLPFVWDNISFNKIVDTDTIILLPNANAHGCDSTVIRHLRVLEHSSSDTSAYYCHGTNFTWYGETYTTADSPVEKTFRASTGCDSIVTLYLYELEPTQVFPYIRNICKGEKYADEHFLDSLSIADTYTHSIPFTKNHSCDSIIYNLQLIVNEPTISDSTRFVRKNELPLTWDNIYFTHETDTTIILRGANTHGCDSTIIRHLKLKPCVPLQASITIDSVCADQQEVYATLLIKDGEAVSYSIHFPSQDPYHHFKDSNDIPLSSAAEQQLIIPFVTTINSTMYIRPDSYPVEFIINDNCEQTYTYDAQMQVLYPSWIIMQRWNDVLTILNENYNGGYTFSNIRWFHNGENMDAQTRGDAHSYVYVYPNRLDMGADDYYWAELTRTDDGKTICTCKMQATSSNDDISFTNHSPAQAIQISQNTTNADSREIFINTDISGTYCLYSSNGLMLQNGYFGTEYGIKVIQFDDSLPIGAYLLFFQGDEGTLETKKLILR